MELQDTLCELQDRFFELEDKMDRLTLRLCNCGTVIDLREKGSKAVMSILSRNDYAQSLWLNSNSLGADGMKILTTVLRYNTSITTLDLSGNNIGDEGAKHVADLLRRNTTIVSICLHNNSIGDEGALALGMALLNNTKSAVKKIYLSKNCIKILPDSFAVLTCMYVCMRACMYVRRYVSMYVCMYVLVKLTLLNLYDNPLRDPPSAVVKHGRDATFKYLIDKRKAFKFALLMGFHPRLGINTAINSFFYRSSIFEPALLQMIFEL